MDDHLCLQIGCIDYIPLEHTRPKDDSFYTMLLGMMAMQEVNHMTFIFFSFSQLIRSESIKCIG